MLSALTAICARAAEVPLFDGKTLDGWEGNRAVWRIEDGAITGGSLEGNPRNEFLATTKSYRNFVLRLEYRIVGSEGFVNGGVQFHSVRLAEPAFEMSGYQADIGPDRSGNLYDESRRRKALAQADKALVAQIEKAGDWNRYEVRCEGARLRLTLNNRLVVEYTEKDPAIPLEGLIALQIHGNNKAVVAYRNISIEVLPKDSAAIERILHEGLQRHQVQLFRYQLTPNHYHLVLRPLVDGEMSRFMGWVGGTHTMRYHPTTTPAVWGMSTNSVTGAF